MNCSVEFDERQYAVLCGDVSLLSAGGRKDVWSALPVSGRWRLRPGESEAAEMRTLFLIRGMAEAAAIIDTAVRVAQHDQSIVAGPLRTAEWRHSPATGKGGAGDRIRASRRDRSVSWISRVLTDPRPRNA